MRFDLSDEEWALLVPLLPKNVKSARVDDRRILNAIFYVLRTGMTKGLYPSFPAVATRPGKPTVPSTSIASATRSKISSVVSKIGGASPHDTTSSLVTF